MEKTTKGESKGETKSETKGGSKGGSKGETKSESEIKCKGENTTKDKSNEDSLKIITWNVNGIRARIFDNMTSTEAKNNPRTITENSSMFNLLKEDPDFICLQETKCPAETNTKMQINGYLSIFNQSKLEGARSASRYSGTAIYYKTKFNSRISKIEYDIPGYNDQEGRIIAIYLDDNSKIILNIYVPYSGTNFKNRIVFQNCLYDYLKELHNKNIKIIYCGDFNVAYRKEDIHFNYVKSSTHKEKNNMRIPGYLPEEREFVIKLLEFMQDTFLVDYISEDKEMNCEEDNPGDFTGFTWWDPRAAKTTNDNGIQTGILRYKNIGWRIDYIFTNGLDILDSKVLKYIGEENNPQSSDHAPLMTHFKKF